jgi:EpsI family protein
VAIWLLLTAALVGGFAHTFVEMWHRWFPSWKRTHVSLYDRIVGAESYYTHGPLVPLISLLIAVLLIRHTRVRVRPRRTAGAIVLVLSLLLHLTACLARVNFASGFALIGVIVGLILLIWGAQALRRLWFPVALLFFMVPLPEVSISDMAFHLKMFAARLGVAAANHIGIAAEQMGNRVLLEGEKTLVIANVCNGLRTLISLLAFGALYTYVCRLRGPWRIGLFVMSLPVALVSNSLRIISLMVVADIWDVETATGFFHEGSGAMVFILAFLMMFGIEKLVLWARRAVGRPAEIVGLFHDVRRGQGDEDQSVKLFGAFRSRRGGIAVALVVLSAAGAWWLNRSIPPLWNQRVAQAALPERLVVDGTLLHGYDIPLDQNTIDILETGDYLNRQYVAAGQPALSFCIIFSKDNRKGTHPPDVCLMGSGEGIVAKGDVALQNVEGRSSVPCREITVQTGARKQYFLYTYKCGGRYTSSFWVQQFTIFLNGLLNRDASGALIRVSTNVQTSVPEARGRSMELLRAAVPHLDRKLN